MVVGNFYRPFPSSTSSNGQRIHVNRVGVVQKGHISGKWRTIMNLSFFSASSVSDGMSSTLCSNFALEHAIVKVHALLFGLRQH